MRRDGDIDEIFVTSHNPFGVTEGAVPSLCQAHYCRRAQPCVRIPRVLMARITTADEFAARRIKRYRRLQARALLKLFRQANGRDAETIEELGAWAQSSHLGQIVPRNVFTTAELRAELRALDEPEASG